MPKHPKDPQLPFEQDPANPAEAVLERGEQAKPTALVHILTPEFQGLDASDFSDISAESVDSASPELIKKYLFDSRLDGDNVVRYQSADREGNWLSIAVNPEHFNLFSRHVPMLARTAINRVLESKDRAQRESTGEQGVRARTSQDIREANRAAVRAIMQKEEGMESYLVNELEPRAVLVSRFMEMTRGKNPNLARGKQEAVRERFENLRVFVFGDMLDAMRGTRGWDEQKTLRAERIIQKRLYIVGSSKDRVKNFEDMLKLAEEYYGNVRALVLGRLAEVHKYYRQHLDVVNDVVETDRQRFEEKQQKQLQLQQDQE